MDEVICPQEYFRLRSRAVAHLKQTGSEPYPHKFHVDISLVEFISRYTDKTSEGDILDDVVTVSGKHNDKTEH